MIERLENALLWLIRLCIVGILFLPLIVVPQALFLYVFGKGIIFQMLVEISVGVWILLCILNKNYLPRFRNAIILSFAFFLFILIVTAFTGIDPSRSFWSTQERMTGIIMYLHVFAYTLLLSSIIKRWFEWSVLLTISVAVNIVVLLFGFLELRIEGGQLASTLGNPVFFAVYALFHFWIACYLFFQENKNILKGIYGCSAALNAAAIIVAGSRGVFLAFLAGIVFFLLFVTTTVAKFPRRRILLSGILMLLLAGVVMSVLLKTSSGIEWGKNNLPLVVSRTLYGGKESNSDRLVLWTIALNGWKERPVLGWGWENYRAVYEKYLIPRPFMDTWYDRSHNQFLDVLVLAGVFGIFSYFLFWFFISAATIRVVRCTKERRMRISTICLGALFFSYFIQNAVAFDSFISLLLFFTTIGLLLSISTHEQRGPSVKRDGCFYWIIFIFAEILIAGMLWHLNAKPLYKSIEGVRGAGQLIFKQDIPKALAHLQKSFDGTSISRAEIGLQIAEIIGSRILNPAWGPPTEQRKELLVFLIKQFENEIKGPPRPNYIQHYVGLSRLYYFLFRLTGDTDTLVRAEDILRTAYQISPQRHQVLAQRADIAVARKQYDQALEYQQRALSLSPSRSKRFLYWGLAYIYIMEEDIQKGVEALQYAQSFGYPVYSDDSLVVPLALAVKDASNSSGVLVFSYIENMLKIQPSNLKIVGAKIIFLHRVGKKNEAKKLFNEIEKKEKSAGVYLRALFKSVHEKILL